MEVFVKYHGDGPHEQPAFRGQGETVFADVSQAIISQLPELVELQCKVVVEIDPEATFKLCEFDPVPAHDGVNYSAAQAIFLAQADTTPHWQLPAANGFLPLGDFLVVLGKAVANFTDCADPQPHKVAL
jgi:hypothetical protein